MIDYNEKQRLIKRIRWMHTKMFVEQALGLPFCASLAHEVGCAIDDLVDVGAFYYARKLDDAFVEYCKLALND